MSFAKITLAKKAKKKEVGAAKEAHHKHHHKKHHRKHKKHAK
ncbi:MULTISPECIES: hypothetical protein [Streptomyces]|nr:MULTISPECIES: hypothetical protein [Streptomyces]RPE37270.1 hypothetical protein EDD90_0084 [Streptomyces sp. Ag109_O5-1]